MPKFMYTIFVLCFVLWWGVLGFLNSNAPEEASKIFLFIFLLFVTLCVTFSIPTFFVLKKRALDFTKLKGLYRKALRQSALISFLICGILTLRAFEVGTALNIVLLTALVLVVGLPKKD